VALLSIKRNSVLPGFGLTLGCTLLYLAVIVALPLLAMILKTASLGWGDFWNIVTSERALATYKITLSAAAVATVFNGLFGLLLAWVLTRYEFPGKRLIDAAVDLPFALPTAIAGLALVTLFAQNGWFGRFLEPIGIKVAYAPLGIMIAMFFTSIPFVIRTVQPVLEDMSADVEEAASGQVRGRHFPTLSGRRSFPLSLRARRFPLRAALANLAQLSSFPAICPSKPK